MRKRSDQPDLRPVWLSSLPVIALGVSFILPLVWLLRMSFNVLGDGRVLEDAFDSQNYIAVFADAFYWGVIGNTVVLGLVVSVITVVLSYPIALFLVKTTTRWKGILIALAIGPLLTSQVARTFGWIAILEDDGVLNVALMSMGIINSPLALSNNYSGTVIALVEVLMPYAILGMISGFGRVSSELELAAGSLGAGRIRTFARVTLPLSVPGVFTGFLLVFVLTISSFVTPSLLGGGRVQVLATEIYNEATQTLNWPLAAALAMILLVIFGVLVSGYQALTRRFA